MKVLTELCLKRPVTTAMFFIALMVLGVTSLGKMPMDLFPQVTYPSISISTSYTGAGPEEIERLITIPIERAVATINKAKSITSNSQEGQSRVRVNFAWGMNLDEAANDIRANLDRIKGRLPDGAGTPTVFKFDPSTAPVLTLGLTGSMDEGALRLLAEEDLSYQIQRVEGVAGVEVRGGKNREIRVYLKQDRLQAYGLTVEQVSKVIENENSMLPAGNITSGVGDFLLRAKGDFQSVAEISNLVISNQNGIPVYLRDLAVVEEGYQTTRSLVRIDGKPGIVMSVQKQSDANTVAVADRVYKVLADLRRQFPEINLRIINDNSTYIRKSIDSVSDSAIVGALLAALILLLFLHNFRATMITAVVMPISILATLILAFFNNMTLNTISLGGLALGVGMLVDNSVVVLDNIFRHHQHGQADIGHAALTGTAEMGSALMASTMTTVCVFFPLIYISGRTGIIFKELSYMVIFSLLCSLVVAVTLIPVLCAKFLKVTDLEETSGNNRIKHFLVETQNKWEDSYQNMLEWCLSHKILVTVGCLVVFLGTLSLFPLIGTELIQNSDEGVISVSIQLPAGTVLEETDLNTRRLEKIIHETVPELEHIETSVGGRYGGGGSTNQSFFTLRLKGKTERKRTTDEIIAMLQDKLKVPGARIRIYAPSNMRMLYGGSNFPVAVDIRGYDQAMARQVATIIQDKLTEIPGINNTNISREEERPEITVRINRQRAADYGITAAQISNAIQANIEGKVATIFRKDGQEYQVRVNLQESDRQGIHDLQKILVSGNGRVVPLMSLGEVVQAESPVSIEREDQERNITVSASLSNRDLASVMQDVKKMVDQLKLPAGINVYLAGDYEEQQQSFSELLAALLLSLLLVYMVMASQFESFLDPFIIMFSIPFALGGVLLILLLTDTAFNTQVYIGLIMLGGVVVNNAIVLISYYRIQMEQGMSLKEAVILGSRSRLRPILITTITTILGLAPLAFGWGEGSETQAPLGRTVIGGLTFSTILTLFLIPVVFAGLENWLERRKNNLRNRRAYLAVFFVLLALSFSGLQPAQAAELKKITLSEAVTIALQNSEESKILLKQRKMAEAAFREAKGGDGLKVYSAIDSTAEETKHQNTLSINLEKSVPVAKLAGIKPLSVIIEEQNRDLALYNLDLLETELITQVITAYQKEVLTRRQLQLEEENLEQSKRFQDEIKTRSKLGLTNLIDEIGAESLVADAEARLNRAKQQYQLSYLKLAQLLNMQEADGFETSPIAVNQEQIDLTSLKQMAEVNRIEVKKNTLEYARAQNLAKLAKLSKQAGLALNWSMERDDYQYGVTLSNQGKDGYSEEWRISGAAGVNAIRLADPEPKNDYSDWGEYKLTLKWFILDGKVRQEMIKQAELLVEQLGEAKKKTLKNVNYEVEAAYYNYLNILDNIRVAAIKLKYQQISLEVAEAKLRLGLVSVKDVLDTRILHHQAELNYEQSQSDLYLAQVQILKAVGQLNPGKLGF